MSSDLRGAPAVAVSCACCWPRWRSWCSVGVAAMAAVYFAFLRDLPDLRTVADYRPPLGQRRASIATAARSASSSTSAAG